jgi:hypothetical protein
LRIRSRSIKSSAQRSSTWPSTRSLGKNIQNLRCGENDDGRTCPSRKAC